MRSVLCHLPRRFCLALLLITIVPTLHGQLPDGQPYIAGFEPDLDVYPQNFSIASDNSGNVYVGNADGVLIYDGDTWHFTSVNGDLVRSLAYDNSNRVYVGGFNTFGYIERNEIGEYEFTDLAQRYETEIDGDLFADIWRIAVNSQGVFFVGLEHLFHYDPAKDENAGFWKHEGSFGPVADYEGQVWLQWRGEGIKSFDGERWQLHPRKELQRDFLVAMVASEDGLIIVNVQGDWFRFRNGEYEALKDSQSIPHRASFTNAFMATDNIIGLTTQLGVVVFYDLLNRNADVVRVSNGFLPEVVRSANGNLLVVDDQGFKALQWPGRWQVIGPNAGLAGMVYAIHVLGDSLYALSSSGAFILDVNQDRFRRLTWTDYEAWDMFVLDSGEILLADSYDIKLISSDGSIRSIDDNTTARRFFASPTRDDLIYVATEYGIQLLLKTDDGWIVQSTVDDLNNLTVTQIIETAPGELLMGSARGGIHAVTINDLDWSVTPRLLTDKDGIAYGDKTAGAYVFEIDDEVFASTGAGLFRFNGESFEADTIDGLDEFHREDESIQLAWLNGVRWAYNSSRVLRWDDGWQEEDVSLMSIGANTTIAKHEDQVLIGNLGSVLIYDPKAAVSQATSSILKLTSVKVDGPDADDSVSVPLDNVRISTADERVTFSYALPDYRNPGTVRYRTRLKPIESGYSSWAGVSQLSLVDLQAGRYTLMVEAKDSAGQLATMEVPLRVEPQWHETSSARLLYVALALAAFYLLFRVFADRRSRKLSRENARLEEKVRERTSALESANKQLDRMAHIDGLTQIPNRRKLDDYLKDVFSQSVERERELAVALIDVDYFKRYNDTQGHQAGDTLLVELARLLSRNLRRSEDLVARYGGEEFLVVMPGADNETACRVIDDMRARVEASSLGVTVSAGVHALVPGADNSVEMMIEQADQALYKAKDNGRNQVVSAV